MMCQYKFILGFNIVKKSNSQKQRVWISSGDLMYNIMTAVNNTALYAWNLLRVGLKCSQPCRTHSMWGDECVK